MTDEPKGLPLDETKKGTMPPARMSRGSLFGSILFGMIILLVLGALTVGIWGGYRGYRMSQERVTLPSIAMLAVGEAGAESADEPPATMPQAEQVPAGAKSEDSVKKARSTAIKVLNGGAAKGSASVLAEALKKAGYTQVTIGNTIKDYSGIVVYFSPEAEAEATAVKDDLLKTYPKTEARPAITADPETTQAPLAIIFGK